MSDSQYPQSALNPYGINEICSLATYLLALSKDHPIFPTLDREQVKQVLPIILHPSQTGITYEYLFPILVKAIQDLKAQVDSLTVLLQPAPSPAPPAPPALQQE